jgi:hypothetical protein
LSVRCRQQWRQQRGRGVAHQQRRAKALHGASRRRRIRRRRAVRLLLSLAAQYVIQQRQRGVHVKRVRHAHCVQRAPRVRVACGRRRSVLQQLRDAQR